MNVIRSKNIRKLFRSKIWPFTVNSIVIYNMAGSCIYCEIKGKNYTLNGFAHDKLKLPNVIDSECMKIDKEATKLNGGNKVTMPTTPVIEIGLSLFSEKEINHLMKIHIDVKILNDER